MEKIFFNNYLLALPVISWIAAQIIKTCIDLAMNRKLNTERLVGSGGMPSSHSALVVSLVTGVVKMYGVSSSWFAVTFVLAVIVMYDAMGVRREAGKQAKVINMIIQGLQQHDDEFDFEERLKEMVGHTPLQVFFGALLGLFIGLAIPVF